AEFAEHVPRGGHDGVVIGRRLVQPLEMVLADAVADADHGHCDSVVGADDTARRRRLVLSVNRGLEQRSRSDSSSGGSGFLDKFPAWKTGRDWRFILFHKTN